MSQELVKVKRTVIELVWCKKFENGELEYHDYIDTLEILEEQEVE